MTPETGSEHLQEDLRYDELTSNEQAVVRARWPTASLNAGSASTWACASGLRVGRTRPSPPTGPS